MSLSRFRRLREPHTGNQLSRVYEPMNADDSSINLVNLEALLPSLAACQHVGRLSAELASEKLEAFITLFEPRSSCFPV